MYDTLLNLNSQTFSVKDRGLL